MRGEGEELLRDDSEQQIKAIYRTHYKDVYHFLLFFTGNENDAEDLTQEVFIRLLRALPNYDGNRSSMKTWILSIANHTAVDQYRRQKLKYLFMEKWIKKLPTSDWLPEAMLDAKEEEKLIEKALHKLKPQYRMVMILRCINGYTIKETAEILECSEAKVKIDYHRAIKMLQQKLNFPREGRWLHELV